MNDIEVTEFVEKEVAARYSKLSDAARGDWIRAVRKADSIETARRIVRAIVDDPEATLTVKAFYKRLRETGGGRPEGKPKFLYREGAPFDVFAVTELMDGQREPWHVQGGDREGRQFRIKLTYPTHRAYSNGTVEVINWTTENLMDRMQSTLRQIRATYGGDWWLEIKEPKPEPAPEIGRKALGGRTLAAGLADKLQAPAPEPAPDGQAVKDMVQRMRAADTPSTAGSTESLFKPQEDKTGPDAPLEGNRPAEVKPGALPDSLAGRLQEQGTDRPKGKLPEKVTGHPFDPEHDKELQGDL